MAGFLDEEVRDDMLNVMCEMSDRQVDPKAKERMKLMLGRSNADIKDELLGLLDDIAFYAWTSDFEIRVLERIWFGCGGTQEEIQARDTSMTAENKAKYKWHR
jgi:hypothetical protein